MRDAPPASSLARAHTHSAAAAAAALAAAHASLPPHRGSRPRRYFPWCVIGFLFFIFNMGVIMMGALVFQDCPDVIITWGQTVLQGLLQSWVFFDPMVIIARNNMKNTKKRIRSKRYQMMEKAIMSPITAFLKFIGKAFTQ